MGKETVGHDGLKSRSFITSTVVFVVLASATFGLAMFDKVTGGQWVDMGKYLATIPIQYGVVNIGQRKYAAKLK